jgi:hypothetical protein
VEHAEFSMLSKSDDNTEGPYYSYLLQQFNSALSKIGRPSPEAPKMKAALEATGFVDVSVVIRKQPQGIWPKDKRLKRIGALALLQCETGVEAYALATLTRVCGMSEEDAKKLCDDALQELKDRKHHSYHDLYVFCSL